MERGRGWSYPRRAMELKERLKEHEIVLSKEPILTQEWDIVHYIPFKTEFVQMSAPLRIAYMGNFGHMHHIVYGEEVLNALKMLDFAVFQDKKLYREVLKAGVDKEKVALVKPGLDLDRFKIKIRIGIAARLRRDDPNYKGEVALLRLFQRAYWKNFKFVFAGKYWKEKYWDKYKAQGIDIEFLDRVPYDEMPNFYNNIDYLLVPSTSESGPLVFVEALACGRPVISRRIGFTPEYNAIFFDNVDELERVLRNIEKEYLERRKQVENLTWDNWANAHKKIYQQMINQRKLYEIRGR